MRKWLVLGVVVLLVLGAAGIVQAKMPPIPPCPTCADFPSEPNEASDACKSAEELGCWDFCFFNFLKWKWVCAPYVSESHGDCVSYFNANDGNDGPVKGCKFLDDMGLLEFFGFKNLGDCVSCARNGKCPWSD